MLAERAPRPPGSNGIARDSENTTRNPVTRLLVPLLYAPIPNRADPMPNWMVCVFMFMCMEVGRRPLANLGYDRAHGDVVPRTRCSEPCRSRCPREIRAELWELGLDCECFSSALSRALHAPRREESGDVTNGEDCGDHAADLKPSGEAAAVFWIILFIQRSLRDGAEVDVHGEPREADTRRGKVLASIDIVRAAEEKAAHSDRQRR
mmetsp:Transcript_8802/g.19586  ORF Transcript_8802/g.19586 Transcript_8802/m.19586 type:complete len:207 (+) Transcript_8802:248-868(+)